MQFIGKDGHVSHNHIMPIFLEKTEVSEDDPRKDLIENIRWMVRGEGSVDFLLYAYDKYRSRSDNTRKT